MLALPRDEFHKRWFLIDTNDLHSLSCRLRVYRCIDHSAMQRRVLRSPWIRRMHCLWKRHDVLSDGCCSVHDV